MKAANWLFLTSIDWNFAPNLAPKMKWKVDGSIFLRQKVYLHESLNCLMMLDTFSKRCESEWCLSWQWEMTRKVARSNSSTSSASSIVANWWSEFSSDLTFGMSWYTMELHARYNVSSQIDVRKAVHSRGNDNFFRSSCLVRKIDSRWSSWTKSILWMRQKIFASGEKLSIASRQDW